ncbi:hypothetical protein DH2020_034809 [Rehmannia glutinosa]|uniref:Thioredoxin domain-containing protein n=1 Tax=Rehmannia glutinosa TaxID=99300 RepID=A0ABR0V935_REHGL
MAISVTAAASFTVKTSPSSSSTSSKLAHFSSLQFPAELRISRVRNHCLKSKHRPRALTLVASKKQTFSSFDELLKSLINQYWLISMLHGNVWSLPVHGSDSGKVSASLIDKIQVVKIDTEKYPSIANEYKIEALPTFILFKDGKPFDRFQEKTTERLLCTISGCVFVYKYERVSRPHVSSLFVYIKAGLYEMDAGLDSLSILDP